VRRKLVLAANLALGTLLLGLMLRGYGARALESLRADPSPPLLAVLLVAIAATIVSLSWRWQLLLVGLHERVSLATLSLQRSAAHSLAVLVPSGKLGGDPLRAWLVAREGVAPGDSIASVAADRTIEIGSTAPFSLIFALVLLQQGLPQIERALVTVVVATVGLAIGVALAARRLRRGAGLVSALARRTRLDRLPVVNASLDVVEASERAAARLLEQPGRLCAAFAAGLGANLLVIAEFWLLLAAFGLPSDPVAVVAAVFATGAAHLLPVPGGIGVLEGAQMWIFAALGYPAEVGLAVGLATRLRELLWMLPGLLYLLRRPFRLEAGQAGQT